MVRPFSHPNRIHYGFQFPRELRAFVFQFSPVQGMIRVRIGRMVVMVPEAGRVLCAVEGEGLFIKLLGLERTDRTARGCQFPMHLPAAHHFQPYTR